MCEACRASRGGLDLFPGASTCTIMCCSIAIFDSSVSGWQVRETSRKPDELYSLLERLSPGTRKLEIFARQHNCQPGWVGLGNQLTGNNIL